MNETLLSIMKRYSCRAYTGEAIKDESLALMVRAAMAAPTGMNRQPYQVIVLKDKTLIDQMDKECMERLKSDPPAYQRFMDRGGKMFYNAPAMFIIAMAPGSQMDVGIVAQNIALAATSLGLGNCHCGMARLAFESDKKEAYEKRLGFLEGYTFGLAVLVGNSAKETAPHEPDMEKVSYR